MSYNDVTLEDLDYANELARAAADTWIELDRKRMAAVEAESHAFVEMRKANEYAKE